MGRGLSDLQEFIISQTNNLGRCYYVDVLEKYYHWHPVRPIERYGNTYTEIISGQPEQRSTPPELIGQVRYPGQQYFSPKQIGMREYRRVMSTLCRSFARLRKRGLVRSYIGRDDHCAGVELTDKGLDVANWLSNRDTILRLAGQGEFSVKIKGRRMRAKRIEK
jgi:hypothetical protein